MKSFLLIVFAFTLILFFSGCDLCSCKKLLCPPFENTHFASWFPYNASQTNTFKNIVGATNNIDFFAMQKSSSYETRRGSCYGSSNQPCMTNAAIYASGSLANIATSIEIHFESQNETQKIISIFIGNNFRIQSKNIDETGLKDFIPVNYASDFYPQLNINGASFNHVQTITKDTALMKDNGIYKLFISRDNGIIGYEHYPTLETWVKQ